MNERRETVVYPAIIAVVAAAASLFMVLVAFRSQGLVDAGGDPYHYGALAHSYLEHGFDKLTRRAATLYVNFLAVVYSLGGGDRVVELIHCALHVGTCQLVYVLGRRVFNARTGLLAALAIALHPMLLRYVSDLHMETLLTFLVTLTIFLTVRFHKEPTVLNGVLLGAASMTTTLTKGVLLPYMVVFGGYYFVRGIRNKGSVPNTAVSAVAMFVTMACLLAPWTYRNYQVTGGKVVPLVPGTGDSFLRGYVFTRLEFATLQRPPYTDAENESNNWFRQIAKDNGTTWELDEVVDEKNNMKVAKYMIVHHPLDTIRKFVVGLFTFWYEMTSLKNSLIPASLAIVSWILAFVGFKRAKVEGQPTWLFWLPIVVMNVFVAALIPLGRYSVPILPLLSILAAFGVDTLLDRRGMRCLSTSPSST